MPLPLLWVGFGIWSLMVPRVTWAQLPGFGESFLGDGTYYGDFQGAGACSFQFSSPNSYTQLPWHTGTSFGVAMNSVQWAGSAPCGMCIAYKGNGAGAGANPVNTASYTYSIVTDLCPECKKGDLDQATRGDGRWKINWYPVQCAVNNTPFWYSFQGSNAYYIKMQIANTRVPVQSVQLKAGTSDYKLMTRLRDNYFLLQGGPPGFKFPAQVTITSLLGDTVTDTVPGGPVGTFQGAAQFPVSPGLPTVGGGTQQSQLSSVTPSITPSSPPTTPAVVSSPSPSPLPQTGIAVAPPLASPPPVASPSPSPRPSPSPSPTPTIAATLRSPTPTPAAQQASSCRDVTPPNGFTCAQQRGFGKCNESWMLSNNWCQATCGRCPTQSASPAPVARSPAPSTCTDVAPPNGFTCAQQRGFGKCTASWMAPNGWCARTCGRCT